MWEAVGSSGTVIRDLDESGIRGENGNVNWNAIRNWNEGGIQSVNEGMIQSENGIVIEGWEWDYD